MANVLNIIRWDMWYDSKLPLLFVCMYYVGLSRSYLDISFILETAGLVLLFCLYASFGYVVNSYSDMTVDLVAGKPNTFSEISKRGGQRLIGILLSGSILLALLMYHQRPAIMALVSLAFAIAALYSLPPARLKERGILGLITPAIAQRTMPTVIIFEAMEYWDLTAVIICFLSTFIGLRYIIVHQIKDENADLRCSVQTIATTRGTAFLCVLLKRAVFPLEVVSLILAVLLMSVSIAPLGVVAVIYIVWFVVQALLLNRFDNNKYSNHSYIVSYSIFGDFYYICWPLFLSTLLVERYHLLWIVFVITFLWSLRRLRKEINYITRRLNIRMLY